MSEQDYHLIHVPLRLNCNNIGGAFTFSLAHHQVNILFDQYFGLWLNTCRTYDIPISLRTSKEFPYEYILSLPSIPPPPSPLLHTTSCFKGSGPAAINM